MKLIINIVLFAIRDLFEKIQSAIDDELRMSRDIGGMGWWYAKLDDGEDVEGDGARESSYRRRFDLSGCARSVVSSSSTAPHHHTNVMPHQDLVSCHIRGVTVVCRNNDPSPPSAV